MLHQFYLAVLTALLILFGHSLWARQSTIFNLNGDRSVLHIGEDADFVKGLFDALPNSLTVQLLCKERNDGDWKGGPYEPVACGSNDLFGDQSYDDSRTGDPFFLLRNFGISSEEYYAFRSGNYSSLGYTQGSAASQVFQAITQLGTNSGLYKWRIKYHELPERVTYKLPGTGPHLHLGQAFPKGEEMPIFSSDNVISLDIHTALSVPRYVKSYSDPDWEPHSSVTLVAKFVTEMQNQDKNQSFTLNISAFYDEFDKDDIKETVATDGTNTYLRTKFSPDATFGINVGTQTKNSAFTNISNFRMSLNRESFSNMIQAYNLAVPTEDHLATNVNKIKFTGISLHNEATNLYGNEIEIQVFVNSLRALLMTE